MAGLLYLAPDTSWRHRFVNSNFQFEERLKPETVVDGRFVVLSEISQGSMGVVYKAKSRGFERIVAIKMLHRAHILDEHSLTRFQREAQVISALDHRNIVKIYAIGVSEQGLPYFVMEYLEGKTLADLFAAEETPGAQCYLNIFIQALEALEHAHRRGVVHRDVKPSNIMLSALADGGYLVKLVDFGVAKLLPDSDLNLQKLTQTGALVGSPLYMSPEHCRAGKLDARSDIYSLGCAMYEAVTGHPPFMDTVATKILYRHLSEQALLFSKCAVRFPVPPTLEAVIFRAMAKRPEDRYQSAAEMAEELRRIAAGEKAMTETVTMTIAQRQFAGKKPSSKRKLIVLGAVTALAVLSAVPVSILFNRRMHESCAEQLSKAALLSDAGAKAMRHNKDSEADEYYRLSCDLYLQASPHDLRPAANAAYKRAYANSCGSNFLQAARLYPQAIELKVRAFGPDSREVAEVERDCGLNYIPLRQFAEAEPHLERARRFYLRQRNPDMEKVIPLLDALVSVYYNQKRVPETERAYLELIKYQEKNGSALEIIADKVDEYAAFLRSLGRIPDADKQHARAESLRKQDVL